MNGEQFVGICKQFANDCLRRQQRRFLLEATRNNRTRAQWTASTMLYTIAVVLIVLWLLGLVTSTTMGGFIHVLIVIAVVVVLLRIISGRKVL